VGPATPTVQQVVSRKHLKREPYSSKKRRRVFIYLPTTKSVMHGQCEARPAVTFPVTNLYYIVQEANVRKQHMMGQKKVRSITVLADLQIL